MALGLLEEFRFELLRPIQQHGVTRSSDLWIRTTTLPERLTPRRSLPSKISSVAI
jgi:hypothetical protein